MPGAVALKGCASSLLERVAHVEPGCQIEDLRGLLEAGVAVREHVVAASGMAVRNGSCLRVHVVLGRDGIGGVPPGVIDVVAVRGDAVHRNASALAEVKRAGNVLDLGFVEAPHEVAIDQVAVDLRATGVNRRRAGWIVRVRIRRAHIEFGADHLRIGRVTLLDVRDEPSKYGAQVGLFDTSIGVIDLGLARRGRLDLRIGVVKILDIKLRGEPDLLYIREAGGLLRGSFRLGEDREQNRGKDCDDCNDDKKLDQRETRPRSGVTSGVSHHLKHDTANLPALGQNLNAACIDFPYYTVSSTISLAGSSEVPRAGTTD